VGRTIMLEAARMLQPHRQGDSSSLCGLYAIINSIQLAAYPHVQLKPAQLKKLLVRGTETLSATGKLSKALRDGMDERTWLLLFESLLEHTCRVTGYTIKRSFFLRRVRGHDARTGLGNIRTELRSGRPVILLLWGAYRHFTVTVGYTPDRLILFDSYDFKWISIDNTGVHHQLSSKRHQIAKRCAVSLWVDPGSAKT
jgi:hypothetical protein